MSLSAIWLLNELPWTSNNAFYLLLRYICRFKQHETLRSSSKASDIFVRFFKNFSSTKFYRNPPSRSCANTCGPTDGWMDGHDEVVKVKSYTFQGPQHLMVVSGQLYSCAESNVLPLVKRHPHRTRNRVCPKAALWRLLFLSFFLSSVSCLPYIG